MIKAMLLVTRRELTLAFRRWSDIALPVVFFVIVCMLFPLALGQDLAMLRSVGPGAIWVAALLATLLSLNAFYREDFDDGSLEQLALAEQPLTILLLGKTLAHWLVTELPLILLAPVLALGFATFVIALAAVPLLGTNLVPDLAQGEFSFRVRMPEGTTLESSAETIERVERRCLDDGRFARVFSVIGSWPSTASGRQTVGEAFMKSMARSAGSQIGRKVMRGILGSIFK